MSAALLHDRALIRISGADAATFLQGLVSVDVAAAGTDAAFGALLTPQGKILFDFLFVLTPEGYLFDVAAGARDALIARLKLYRLRAKVEIEPLSGWSVAASTGEVLSEGEVRAFPDPRLLDLGARLIGPRAAVAARIAGADVLDYERHRIARVVPEFGKDFGPDEMFLLDVNADALNGVSYKKGCFVGQEVSSRMKRKGEIRRRTVLAAFEGAAPPKGAPIVAGDSTLGEILSGVDGMALAAARLDRLEASRAAGAEARAEGKSLRLEVPDYLEAR